MRNLNKDLKKYKTITITILYQWGYLGMMNEKQYE